MDVVYRKTVDGGHYYRIQPGKGWLELQRVGTRWLQHRVEAVAYPEQVRAMELVSGSAHVVPCSPEEFHERAGSCAPDQGLQAT